MSTYPFFNASTVNLFHGTWTAELPVTHKNSNTLVCRGVMTNGGEREKVGFVAILLENNKVRIERIGKDEPDDGHLNDIGSAVISKKYTLSYKD